jgi:hypothetical protein
MHQGILYGTTEYTGFVLYGKLRHLPPVSAQLMASQEGSVPWVIDLPPVTKNSDDLRDTTGLQGLLV